MVDKIKITKTTNSFGKASKETVEVSGEKLAQKLDAITSKLGYNEKSLDELTKQIEKQRKIAEANGNKTYSTKDYLDQIKLNNAILGLNRQRLEYSEFLNNYEKRIKALNKEAYKDNVLYKSIQAVKNEQNSVPTAIAANIGLAAATGGMINPLIAQALHLDKLITAPITAITRKLLGMGHTTSSAIANELENEKTEKIKEIALGVNKINTKLEKKTNISKEKESSGLLSILGNIGMAVAGYFASKFLLDKFGGELGLPSWANTAIPWAVAGFALGGMPGAIAGGLLGFFQEDLVKLSAEYLPKIKKALDEAIEDFKKWFKENPIPNAIKEIIKEKWDETKEKAKDVAIDAAMIGGGTLLSMWLAKLGIKKGLPALGRTIKNTVVGTKTAAAANAATNSFATGSNMISAADANLTAKAVNDNAKIIEAANGAKNLSKTAKVLQTGKNIARGTVRAVPGMIITDTLINSAVGAYNTLDSMERNIGSDKKLSEVAKDEIADMFMEDAAAWNSKDLPWYWKPFIFGGMAIDSMKALGGWAAYGGARKAERDIAEEIVDKNNLTKRDQGFIDQSVSQLTDNLKETIEDPNGITAKQLATQQEIAEILNGILKIQEDTYHMEHNIKTWEKNQAELNSFGITTGTTNTTGTTKSPKSVVFIK